MRVVVELSVQCNAGQVDGVEVTWKFDLPAGIYCVYVTNSARMEV
jgi:hypothetical protein